MSSFVLWTREYRPARCLLLLAVAGTVAGCSDPQLTEPNETKEPPPAVSISVWPNTATLLVGEVAYLSASAYTDRGQAVSTPLAWASSDPAVATVSQSGGTVTGVGIGTTTITVSAQGLTATASIAVVEYHPAARILISLPEGLIINVGTVQRVSAVALDAEGHYTPAPIAWTSQDPGIATIGVDAEVTAVGVGTTVLIATAGSARTTVPVEVVPPNFLMQWATAATASTEYAPDDFSAAQALGAPNVEGCYDGTAWASADADIDWIELEYLTPVRPREIRIYEVWAPGSIVKVEVRDLSGAYHTVYTATPQAHAGCMRTLNIPVTTFNEPVNAVRLTLDQRLIGNWNEVDAVRLLGYRIN